MTEIDDILLLFSKGFNCAQALLAVYGARFGIERETALKIASAFGGGMGKMGDTCGVVTGALMIIGLKYGTADANDKKSEAKTYKVAREFIERFQARNKSSICRELLGFDMRLHKREEINSEEIILGQCTKYVQDTAQILEEII